MKRRRISVAGLLIKGIVIGILTTLIGMLIMAAAIVYIGMSDTLIRALNQVLKILSVALGTYLAVKRGGERGLLTGAGIGAVYSIAGYLLFILLGGNTFNITSLLGEMTICIAAGALAGAVCANLKPMRKTA
jgi:putative membrane protein (TIGR04086 family)